MAAKVTLTPSEEVLRATATMHDVQDTLGRTITLKKPTALAQYRLVEAVGKTAENQTYMGMVLPLLFVNAIDNIPVPAPNSKGEVEALITRLEDAGLQAVIEGVQRHYGDSASGGDDAKKSAA